MDAITHIELCLCFAKFGLDKPGGISKHLTEISRFCEHQARLDENLSVQEYHDQWMITRRELLNCAETIRKGGE